MRDTLGKGKELQRETKGNSRYDQQGGGDQQGSEVLYFKSFFGLTEDDGVTFGKVASP